MSNDPIHTEQAFESVIEDALLQRGYERGDNGKFDRELVFNSADVLVFLRNTQSRAWQELGKIHGPEVEKKFLFRLTRELDARGMLDCLRNGVVDYGVRFQLCHFAPVSSLNPETAALYAGNRLQVYRQLRYSKRHDNEVDVVLAVNGLPVLTMELKNQLTGQTAGKQGRKQYIQDRDPNDLLFQFKKRALVHFSVDTDEVWMTTRVAGKQTVFLPFNQGHNKAAGNPPNPNGHRTAYLWETIFARDSLLDLLGRFVHLERKEVKLDGKAKTKEALIFPRFHQLRAVRRIGQSVKQPGCGPGKNYLIQHSAGSGKSHTIAWLAHRLASLHDANSKLIYDSVVIITDRLVLDQQLQDIVYQIEHKTGVVEKIDRDSQQLAEALKTGKKIIVTTLQKFPFVMEHAEVRDVWRAQSQVKVSDPSRTIVDLLDDPPLGGGMRHVADVLRNYFEGTSRNDDELAGHAVMLGSGAVFKRLGYLLETLGIASPKLVELCTKEMSTGISLLDPSAKPTGAIVKRWGLRVNVTLVADIP